MEFRRRFMSSFFSSSIRIATGYSASVISAIQAKPYKLSGAHQRTGATVLCGAAARKMYNWRLKGCKYRSEADLTDVDSQDPQLQHPNG